MSSDRAPILFNSKTPRWAWLSNFYPIYIQFNGKIWRSAEHLYQSSKTTVDEEIEQIRCAMFADKAKRLGRKVTMRPDWEEVKLDVMRIVTREKFTQGGVLLKKLIETHPRELIHLAPWDNFWGNGKNGQGLNWQGKILMEVRQELIDASKD